VLFPYVQNARAKQCSRSRPSRVTARQYTSHLQTEGKPQQQQQEQTLVGVDQRVTDGAGPVPPSRLPRDGMLFCGCNLVVRGVGKVCVSSGSGDVWRQTTPRSCPCSCTVACCAMVSSGLAQRCRWLPDRCCTAGFSATDMSVRTPLCRWLACRAVQCCALSLGCALATRPLAHGYHPCRPCPAPVQPPPWPLPVCVAVFNPHANARVVQ
jgi:hypothetical protein